MKDLGDFSKWLDKLVKNTEEECIEMMRKAVEDQKQNAVNRIEIPDEARNTYQFIEYRDSIDSKLEVDGDSIIGTVYSDLLVGGDDPKWADVPVGMFLECGTGELGMSTNNYPHGYDYTLHVWDRHTWLQQLQTGTFGIRARPHMIPAFNEQCAKMEDLIDEARTNAWMKSVN